MLWIKRERMIQVPVSLPTREQIAEAFANVDYPGDAYDGYEPKGKYLQYADAVLALLAEPTPTAEPKPSLCAKVQPHDPHANTFRVWARDGYYDVPGTCPGVPATSPRIEDMAPGTTLGIEFRWTVARDPSGATFLYRDNNGYAQWLTTSDVDPTTIRDVTPPKEDTND